MSKFEFGIRIKQLRKICRLTQKELAVRIGSDATYISHIEHGHIVPSEHTIRRLSDVLHVPDDELLDLAGWLDKDALQAAANANPDITHILRRLQTGVSDDIISEIMAVLAED